MARFSVQNYAVGGRRWVFRPLMAAVLIGALIATAGIGTFADDTAPRHRWQPSTPSP